MSDQKLNGPEGPNGTAGSTRHRVSQIGRLVAAYLLSVTVLPYCGARLLFVWMLSGMPERTMVLGLVAGVSLIWLLVRPFRVVPRSPRHVVIVGTAILVSWLTLSAAAGWYVAGHMTPRLAIAACSAPAGLALPWMAWMPALRCRWLVKLGVVPVLLACLVGFVCLFEVEGLTGDSRLNFAWRRWNRQTSALPTLVADPDRAMDELLEDPARDWPRFLGSRGDGILPRIEWSTDWQGTPPRLLWRRPVGTAWSSFAVIGQAALTQEQRGAAECIVCYDLKSGKERWIDTHQVQFASSLGGVGPRATPTVQRGRVFAVGATGILTALDGASGRRLWSVDILADQDAENIEHGVAGSPLVVDSLVLVAPTGSQGPSLVAYDAQTGDRRWQAGDERASYSSPALVEWEGRRQVLLHTSVALCAFELESGKQLWRFPWTNSQATCASQPVVLAKMPHQILVSAGYGAGCALIQIGHAPDGSWPVKPIWKNNRLNTKFSSAIVQGDNIYGLNNSVLTCLDANTGRTRWKQGRFGYGQILLAGGLLLVQAESGDVVLIRPTDHGFDELGRLKALDGKTWNYPALAGRYLLVRNDRQAACYELPLEL